MPIATEMVTLLAATEEDWTNVTTARELIIWSNIAGTVMRKASAGSAVPLPSTPATAFRLGTPNLTSARDGNVQYIASGQTFYFENAAPAEVYIVVNYD